MPEGIPNDRFYLFDLSDLEAVTWDSLTAEQLATPNPTPNPSNTPNPPSIPSPNTSKSDINSSSTTAASSDEISSNQTNQTVIVGLSVGLGAIGIASIVAFALIYKRIKKNRNTANTAEFEPRGQYTSDVDVGVLQIPPGDKYYPTMYQRSSINQQHFVYQQNPLNHPPPINQQYPVNQQFTQPTPQYHLNYSDYSPTLTAQSQPGQEFSNLQALLQERNSTYLSNFP